MKQLWYKKISPVHGSGLFASCDISEESKIIEYIGEKITKKVSLERIQEQFDRAQDNGSVGSVYIFTLNKRYDIDGDIPENYAKFINHSCDPNCVVYTLRGKIWVLALKDIQKDEELTYNYNFSFNDDYEDYPCSCGAHNCIGYILAPEEWHHLENKDESTSYESDEASQEE